MTAVRLIYDDSVPVPPEVTAVAGIRHFGDLIYRKTPLSRLAASAAAAAGMNAVDHLRNAADFQQLLNSLAAEPSSARYLYLPANLIVQGDTQALADFLGKLRWLRQNVVSTVAVNGDGWVGAAAIDRDTLRRLLEQQAIGRLRHFMGEHRGAFEDIGNGSSLVDLADKRTLLRFLASHFDARHFNAIAFDTYTVRKSSADKNKIRREYSYWRLLPDSMKFWFVQPFDLRDDGERASYAMERLNVPDIALQWIHRAIDDGEFCHFLDRIFHFLKQRPTRDVTAAEAGRAREAIYRGKLVERLDRLRQHSLADRLDGFLRSAGMHGGLDALDAIAKRYTTLLDSLERRRKDVQLVVGHGDLCFSNILYEKETGLLRLIDPRGADTAAELWADPYYDIAKLSHSVLGCYDYINNGLFDVVLGQELDVQLNFHVHAPLAEKQAAFRRCVAAAGFDIRLVRLYEASLFLSMTPLHMDMPIKALAFVLNAQQILNEVERG